MPSRGPGERIVLERLWRTAAGPWAIVGLGPVGFRLAYVLLPDGLDPELARDVPVHGGVTFVGRRDDPDLFEGGDGVPPGTWVGWDYGHFDDLPEPELWARAAGGRGFPIRHGRLWTTDEVAAECERAAAIVAGVAAYHGAAGASGPSGPPDRAAGG